MNKKIVVLIIIAAAGIAMLFVVLGKRKKSPPETITSVSLAKPSLGSASKLAAQAKDLELKGNFSEAKILYQKLINFYPNTKEMMRWQKKLEDLNMKLLFSPVVTSKSILREIKPGDTLTKIAKEFNTTVELIMRANRMIDDKLVPGRKLKVWNSPFSILVDKSQNILILKSEEEILKTYIVSTGMNNSTPAGTFTITNKLINPTWFKAGAVVAAGSADNLLGTRWLGFNLPGYGIHGTTDPASLGKQVTQGCVRMANAEVEELFSIVPNGTEVTIVD